VQWPAAQLDLAMMAALGSRVRRGEQWGGLREVEDQRRLYVHVHS
jgi:hypothetical protein